MTSAQVRDALVDALKLDLVGPSPEDASHFLEVLRDPPSRWYLTGFLVPFEGGDEDDEAADQLDLLARERAGDDEAPPEQQASARRAWFPSSLGLSLLVPAATRSLTVVAE